MATATATGLVSLEQLTPAQLTLQETKMLIAAQNYLQHTRFGEQYPLRPRTANAITLTRMSNFSDATTSLDEGVTPAAQGTTLTTVTITPSYYGAFCYITRAMEDKGIFNIVNDISDRLGYQAGKTADTLCRNTLIAGGTSSIVGQSAEGNVTASNIMKFEEIVNAVRILRKYSALPLPTHGNKYAVILHPDTWYDLFQDSEFRSIMLYAKERGEANPVFGDVLCDAVNARFFMSENAYINTDGGSGSVDTYHTLVIGEQAYGVAGLSSNLQQWQEGGTGTILRPIELMTHPRGDYPPLQLRSSIGWLIDQGQAVLNANFMVRIIHACSKGSNT